MHLLLGQLVYTSFPGIGFRTLASAKVPTEIQQAFIERVVSQHWDSYNPPMSGYRAVYLHQLTPEHTLFGWLYNDGADDMGRSDVPYFICYYLSEPLYAFQLDNIFTWFHLGPLALIDRHSLPATLETKVVPDLWSYQGAKPGVAIPLSVRKRRHIAFKQGELLNLFVPVAEQEMVIELNRQSEEQQRANFSIDTPYLIEGIDMGAAALDIETAIIKYYIGYKDKLQRYEQAFVSAMEREYPISDNTRNSLRHLQQVLRLTDQDIEPIEAYIQDQTKAVQPQELVAVAIKSKDVTPVKALNEDVAVNEAQARSVTGTVLPQMLSNKQTQISSHNSVLAYKSSQLLLKIGIVATFLALTGSMYGLLQTNIFAPGKPEFIPSPSSPVFDKTLVEIPNIRQ